MKRVQLLLPDPVVDWIDAQADGIESRASFIRRSIVGLMRAEQRAEQQAEQRRLPINSSLPESSGDGSQRPGRAGQL
jgi:hypothetical protein